MNLADILVSARSVAMWLWAIASLVNAAPAAMGSPPMFRSASGQFPVLRPLDPAPMIPLLGLDERVSDLGRFGGKVVVVNFWATSCLPCIAEIPALDRLAAASDPRQLAVVAIAIDAERLKAVAPFVVRNRLAT